MKKKLYLRFCGFHHHRYHCYFWGGIGWRPFTSARSARSSSCTRRCCSDPDRAAVGDNGGPNTFFQRPPPSGRVGVSACVVKPLTQEVRCVPEGRGVADKKGVSPPLLSPGRRRRRDQLHGGVHHARVGGVLLVRDDLHTRSGQGQCAD